MSITTARIAGTLARLALSAVLSGLTLSAAISPALAASQDQGIRVQPSRSSTSDLDLTKPVDRAALQQRQASTARTACHDLPEKGLNTTGGFQKCYIKAMLAANKEAETMARAQQGTAVAATR
jgi:UrcA family protein